MNTKLIELGFIILSKIKINDYFISRKRKEILNTNFIILTYHDTYKKIFMDQMQFLDKKYDIISFDDFYNQFKKHIYPSDPKFIITFDDGRGSFYREAYPVCKEISIPVINYITTQNVMDTSLFWWDEFKEINKLGGKLDEKSFFSMTSSERNQLLNDAGKKLNYIPKKGDILSKEQIQEMNQNKNISFGSHSVSHTNLALENENNIRFELGESKKFLETLLRKEVTHFSYPNGDYNKNIISILEDLGYKSSVKTGNRWVSKNDSLFELSRVGGGPPICSIYWLEARISGAVKLMQM